MGGRETHAGLPCTRGRSATAIGLGVAVLGLAALATLPACRSRSHAEVGERVLALEKNAPVAALGLRRIPLTLDTAGGPRELELVHLRVGPDSGAQDRGAPRLPVVLVHGTPSTLASWTEIAFGVAGRDGLSAQREVVALEVVGHGMAPGNVAPYSFQRCADFVTAALRALDLGPVHLVGSSYGGEFVWRSALDAPELVASVTLLDSSGYPRDEGGWLPEEVEMRENPLAGWGYLINSEERVETALAPHFRELPPDRVAEFTLVCSNAGNWRAMIDLVRDEDGARAQELPNLDRPALVLWGAEDIAYTLDAVGRRFAADLPRAELVAIEGAGHYPHEERPEAVLDALEAFFTETETAR